jgi:Ca-activated chloride channel family protein
MASLNHSGSWAAVVVLVCGAVLLGGAAPAPQDSASSLEPKYRDFLIDVAPLITAKERAVFVTLVRDYQRDEFIRRFWEVRNPTPQERRNLFEEVWTERVAAAKDRYGTLEDDRARMLLLVGPPARNIRINCQDSLRPLEVWSYEGGAGDAGRFAMIFVQSQGAVGGRFHMWRPGDGIEALSTLEAQTDSKRSSLSSLVESCPGAMDLGGYLSEAADGDVLEAKLHLVPRPGDEWLTRFSSFSTDVPKGAARLAGSLELSFPGRYGNRTVAQGVLTVPVNALTAQLVAAEPSYSFVLDGEVLRDSELLEHFHYLFNLPTRDAAAGSVPLVFERHLRPGHYSLVVKLEELAGQKYFRDERELDVPQGPLVAEAPSAETTAPTTAASSSGATPQKALAEANAALPVSADSSVRLLRPPEGLLTGSVRVEAVAAGAQVGRVSFYLDGKPVLSKANPPYSVTVNLGREPRMHKLKVVATDRRGQSLAEDGLVLNAGPHRFGLRLVDPQSTVHYHASLRAQAQVDVPEGETLDRVEFYLNESLVSTLFQSPFIQPILLREGDAPSYVRAVAYLVDGSSTEDLVLVNSPNPAERVDVQFVELYTTVTDHRGRPAEGLTRDDFKVFEDGSEQTIRRFELVRDMPIHAGVLIDTSGSMGSKLDAAVQGALAFFKQVIKPRDRAAVFTFSSEPNLAVRFTNDQQDLAAGLEGLHAEGNTVLYDTIIDSLYYFGGIRGKRAIILLTDGRDEGSKYQYKDALEYARHSGVAFYTVGIGLGPSDSDVHFKLRELAEETGGRAFFIEYAGALKDIYVEIERELRSQYLVAYQSSKAGGADAYRSVTIKLGRPDLEARTLRGYYP